MNQSTPYLLRFAKTCISPNRANLNSEYIYDHEADMVRWTGSPDFPVAISVSGQGGPKTKKADVEKGEDNKDRRMWR